MRTREIAAQLVQALPYSSVYCFAGQTPEGLSVDAVLQQKNLLFSHNLGSHRPSKAEATAILQDMLRHSLLLKAASAEFAALTIQHPCTFLLEVFSGHMCFEVASWDGVGEISWAVSLD